MNDKYIRYKFRNKSFAGYGLNKYRNFLKAPTCECGCGKKASLLLKDKTELYGFIHSALMDNECDNCAIFAHSFDDKLYVGIKCEDDESFDPVEFLVSDDRYTDFFQAVDAEWDLHCYGLIIETRNGKWEIIED